MTSDSVRAVRIVDVAGPRGQRFPAEVPTTRTQRRVGLRDRTPGRSPTAMLFERCRSVHTIGMRFPITVIGLDRRFVVRWVAFVPPRRLVLPRRTVRHILEIEGRTDIRLGDRLLIREVARPERRRGEEPTTLRPLRR